MKLTTTNIFEKDKRILRKICAETDKLQYEVIGDLLNKEAKRLKLI